MNPPFATMILAAAALGSAVPAAAQERLFVEITEGVASALTVGVPDTLSGVPVSQNDGVDAGIALARILRADLATDPFFRLVEGLSSDYADDRTVLRDYAGHGTQALVIGRARQAADGLLIYSCTFYDVFSGVAEVTREFRLEPREWRRAAHKCADMVVAHATGYPGHFDTRFALVGAGVGGQVSPAQLFAVDFGGAAPTPLGDAPQLVAMPRQSPDNRSVLFMAYAEDLPGLIVADLTTGRRSKLKLPPGLPSAARFSPDGRRIALAISQGGNTDVYEFELATGRTIRLTDTTGTDTSPSYSPDGTRIVFESDRSGQPQLYVMQRDGSGQRRISFGEPHSSPVWSPDGQSIAFATTTQDGTRIGVMAPDGAKRRVLTEGPFDEDPVWAPSSRAIAFQHYEADGTAPQLRIVDAQGRRQFAVPVAAPGTEPDWSEILP